MTVLPRTRYAKSHDLSIAYTVIGDGPIDLVFVPGFVSHLELLWDDLAGMAIHIGARVSALAGPGEVLVSSTVRDLVVGSGIEFEDRGPYDLKGVPGAWRLFGVAAA